MQIIERSEKAKSGDTLLPSDYSKEEGGRLIPHFFWNISHIISSEFVDLVKMVEETMNLYLQKGLDAKYFVARKGQGILFKGVSYLMVWQRMGISEMMFECFFCQIQCAKNAAIMSEIVYQILLGYRSISLFLSLFIETFISN